MYKNFLVQSLHKYFVHTFLQVPYSLLWRSVEYDILPLCSQNNIDVLAYSPLQQGLLSGKYLKLDDVLEGRRRTRLFSSNRYSSELVNIRTC